MAKKVAVIGSGFAGLSAAAFMAKAGWDVHVIEKHAQPGGRARKLSAAGFHFDMGPSWYWMPDVFERFFNSFGKSQADMYNLIRLNPSYRIYFDDGFTDMPASYGELRALFESLEGGAGNALDRFIAEAGTKYQTGMLDLAYKPGRSFTEYLHLDVFRQMLNLDLFSSVKSHISKYFRHPRIRQILSFPVLFLGALPEHTPALYTLMNYADLKLGTWYPMGGMYKIVEAMHKIALEQGVKFSFSTEVRSMITEGPCVKRLVSSTGEVIEPDVVIGGADYHHIEKDLLPENGRSYSSAYWNSRKMAPSSLIFYVGLNTRLKNIRHHSLFFDAPFDVHANDIYRKPDWPANPLFYMSAVSVTDPEQAPAGGENLFFLIPLAAGISADSEKIREKYFDILTRRLEKHTGTDIRKYIVFKKSFGPDDFVHEYHAFKGNAYGLANTLRQTAIFKPSCRSKKLRNLFFTGQLTVPGPGVPPSLISGEVVSGEVVKYYGKG